MIIKKLNRVTVCSEWNDERKKYEHITVTDYLGWYLFGKIPLYLIELNKEEQFDYEDLSKPTMMDYTVIKKYSNLLCASK